MKRLRIPALLLALILILCACTQQPQATPPIPGTSDQQQTAPPQTGQDTGTETDPPVSDTPDPSAPLSMETLTVELVVEWEDVDERLSQKDKLTELLRTALEESGCTVEQLTITINTAGGITAEALTQGGVDAAVLPAADFITCRESIAGIAMSQEEISETVIALSLTKGLPDSDFCSIFFNALTATEAGQEFLSICRPGAVFDVPTEEAMQAVLDSVAQQEQEMIGGHGE